VIELVVFVVAGAVCLGGAVGVVASRNPVHAALSLVATLFGVAVLFIAQEANFLAAVQVIVYAGAIVVLFLFVIMLLGVDQLEDLRVEPLVLQRFAAGLIGLGIFALPVVAMASTDFTATGVHGTLDPDLPDIDQLGEALFTRYLFAFEVTSLLLVIAVVGAVTLTRRTRRDDEIVDPGQAERAAELAERLDRAESRATGGAAGQPADAPAEGIEDGDAPDPGEGPGQGRPEEVPS
jgi:NADH-quinone oxidoreductase subunit J